jgi:hypothetical protein
VISEERAGFVGVPRALPLDEPAALEPPPLRWTV